MRPTTTTWICALSGTLCRRRARCGWFAGFEAKIILEYLIKQQYNWYSWRRHQGHWHHGDGGACQLGCPVGTRSSVVGL